MIDLATIKQLGDAGFGKAVNAANSLIGVKNSMAGDSELVEWAGWAAADFMANLGVGQAVADTMVALMAALKVCYLTIKAQDFPPNAV